MQPEHWPDLPCRRGCNPITVSSCSQYFQAPIEQFVRISRAKEYVFPYRPVSQSQLRSIIACIQSERPNL
jgi:hypothetical protein